MAYPLAQAVRQVDHALRHHFGIREFTCDEDCIFRVSPSAAGEAVRLSDGTEIRPGDPLLQLHLWNEHLPHMRQGPNAGWANRFRRAMHGSLVRLAAHVMASPDCADIRAFYGFPPFGSRIGAVQMVRTAQRFGFDVLNLRTPFNLRDRCHEVLDSMLLWGLAYTFNPGALRGKSLIRHRYQLWISRTKLLALYGAEGAREACEPAWRVARNGHEVGTEPQRHPAPAALRPVRDGVA